MIRKLSSIVRCAWCGWTTDIGRTMKDGRTVCALCIIEETQD